jgi:Fe-S cluster assembly scaffold protein SufB
MKTNTDTSLINQASPRPAMNNQISSQDSAIPVPTLTINRPPAITWHHLAMNEACVSAPALGSAKDAVTYKSDITYATGDRALAAFKEACKSYASSTIETGVGPDADQWLADQATEYVSLDVPADGHDHQLDIDIVPRLDGRAIAATDIVVEPDAHLTVTIRIDSPEGGAGLTGSRLRIVALDRSVVEIQQLQTLDQGWRHIDALGIVEADNARVHVDQLVLGSSEVTMGLSSDVRGYAARCDVDTRYLGQNATKIDFNYVLHQRGKQTQCTLIANGILTGHASKLLRGTIDLVHGCKGSVGRETETVLLTSEHAVNKTIPVILCDEEDVQGDHGATIGHINPAQMEYMQTRGLSIDRIEHLFVRSTLDYARAHVASDAARTSIDALAKRTIGESLDDDEEVIR